MRASEQVPVPLDVSGVLFEATQGWALHKALRKVLEQTQLLSKPLNAEPFCLSISIQLALTARYISATANAGPKTVSGPLLQSGGQLGISTMRDPSMFETIETATRRKAQPKCSRCHTSGHTMTSRAALCDTLRFSSHQRLPQKQRQGQPVWRRQQWHEQLQKQLRYMQRCIR